MSKVLTTITMGLSPESQDHLRTILSGGMLTVTPENLRTTVLITDQRMAISEEDRDVLITATVTDARLWYDSATGGSSWIATLQSAGLTVLRRYLEEEEMFPYFHSTYRPFLPLMDNFPPLAGPTRGFLASINNTLVTSDYEWEFTDLRADLVEYNAIPYREYHEASA